MVDNNAVMELVALVNSADVKVSLHLYVLLQGISLYSFDHSKERDQRSVLP